MEVAATSLMNSWAGPAILAVLVISYVFVIFERSLDLRKSKPVLLGAGIIWLIIGLATYGTAGAEPAALHLKHAIADYSEILLFLMVAMSYINILEERRVFSALNAALERGGWTWRSLFWLTGTLAFFISPVADNMTTALLMGAVVLAVGGSNRNFIILSCINIVVAANAGGAFSPFGDITTLMVWVAGKVAFADFFQLFLPSLVTWLVPAAIMSLAISNDRAMPIAGHENSRMRKGAKRVMVLGVATIATSVLGHQFFHFPPVYGMLFGLSYLKIFGYYLKIRSTEDSPFDVLHHVQKIEWDTLLFFGGVILAIAGVGYAGYLSWLSATAYTSWGGMPAEISIGVTNVMVGIASAIIDNIPIMFAVLSANPEMSKWQWLLVTLTAGVGGSMLSIGSAAGVALMGASRGYYTFAAHLKWTWAVALGYFAGIGVHYLVN